MNLIAGIAAFSIIWVACLGVLLQENRQLKRDLSRAPLGLPVRRGVLRLARNRGIAILSLLALFAASTLALGWKAGRLNRVPEAPPPPVAAALPAPQLPVAPAPPPAEAPQITGIATPAPVVLSTPPRQNDPMSDLFDAPAAGAADASSLDEIKRRYENLFVNYLFHTRCGSARKADYYLLNTALLAELAASGGPSRMQSDILTAARGSYQEVYAGIPCDRPEVATQAGQFRRYLESIQAQQSAP